MAEHPFTVDAARALGGPAWLRERRVDAAGRLDAMAWPSASEEIWRYSPIDEFDPARFAPPSEAAPGAVAGADDSAGASVAGTIGTRDGIVVHRSLDDAVAAKDVRVGSLRAFGDDPDVRAALGSVSSASEDTFTVLHDAFLADAAVVMVPAGVVVEDPVVVVHEADRAGAASFPHTLVVAGESSQVTVLDRYVGVGDATAPRLCDAVVELVVEANAHVRYLSVQEQDAVTWHLALQRAHVAADSTLRSSAVALGGDYTRLRSESLLSGPGAQSDLLAVYFGSRDQVLDFRTLQDHAAPHTRSDLLFKGAVEDRGRSVYSGLVRLRAPAQRAEAHQTNRNLVLSAGAGAESIPNLEIEANDVRCSHASTVGPIDEDQRYYLESRGIPPEEAERLIVLGFFDDVFARLPATALVGGLRAAVVTKLESRERA